MRKKIHIKKKRYNIINSFIIIIIINVVMVIIILSRLNDEALPLLMDYAYSETVKLSTEIINKSVLDEIRNISNVNSLISVTTNSKEEIVAIDFNNKEVNRLLTVVNNSVSKSLYSLEFDNGIEHKDRVGGGILYYVPFGVISPYSITNNLGPKIPLKITLFGSVTSSIESNIKEYGINNVLIKINIKVTVNQIISLPFIDNKINVSLNIPIITKMIQGKIPNVYGGQISTNSSLNSLEIEQ